MKDFYRPVGTLNGMKTQTTEWEKVFANPMSDKGLISRKYNNPAMQQQQQQQQTQLRQRAWVDSCPGMAGVAKTMGRDARHHQSLGKCTSAPPETAFHTRGGLPRHTEEQHNTTRVERWEGTGSLAHCWQRCKLVQPLWKTVWQLPKKPKIEFRMIKQFLF